MTYRYIEVVRQGNVLELALNRPAQMNALTPEMVTELRDALQTIGKNGERALLITGKGRAFCAGADLASETFSSKEQSGGYGESVAQSLDVVFNPLIRDLYALEVPTVCALNGVAAGGGVGLALASDICIAAKSASFLQVFGPRLGIVPDAGSSWFVAHLVGRARALGMAMLGDRIPADVAAAWGLCWACVDDADLLTEARAIAAKLASGPTRAFPRIRHLSDAAFANSLSSQLDAERDQQRILCDSADTVEGVAAFRQKREPVFIGR